MAETLRRIVTGHDAEGKAIIVSDGPPGKVVEDFGGIKGLVFYEFWATKETPARIDRRTEDPVAGELTLAPPKGGVRIRLHDFPPDDESRQLTFEQRREHFAAIGAGHAVDVDAPHPFMHRTQSIDYGIVLDGEIVLIVDKGETVCRKGDVIVQRGTNHAWANRSGKNCHMAFILIDGTFVDGL